ncbi:hypothetical protein Ddc_01887 [Ditylenchus destructor]|nr:hypothetical protein Ddc_01887 [Ditylenchus destructor]
MTPLLKLRLLTAPVLHLRALRKYALINGQQCDPLIDMFAHELTEKGLNQKGVDHIVQCYKTYLQSTAALSNLQEKYAGREMSVADSAKLVGLKLPKLHDQSS